MNPADLPRWLEVFHAYSKRYGTSRVNPARDDPYHGRDKQRPWWPMRYFEEDTVLAAWVYRIYQRSECQVGLFLDEDHYRYVAGSAATGGIVCLLTQTFHQLGTMAVRFVGRGPRQSALEAFERTDTEADLQRLLTNGFESTIPESIVDVARALNVHFRHLDRIDDDEGRRLFARITGFSEATLAALRQRGIDVTQACYLVQRDIWRLDQVEYLLTHAASPERLFAGGVSPVARLPHQRDLLVLRTVLLEERVRTMFEQLSGSSRPYRLHAKWASATRLRYTADRDFAWEGLRAPAGESFEIALAPHTSAEYAAMDAGEFRGRHVAVTRDYEWSGASLGAQVRTVPILDTVWELDAEIAVRLRHSLMKRAEVEWRD